MGRQQRRSDDSKKHELVVESASWDRQGKHDPRR